MLYLLRVGVDKKYGGFHSPIFSNYSYLFIPIPDNGVISEKSINYSDYKWNKQNILPYIPENRRKELSSRPVHNDPEFVTCTYGSPKFPKKSKKNRIEKNYNKLVKFEKDYLLVFYAAFSNKFEDINESKSGYYFFAYFVIEKSICYETSKSLEQNDKDIISMNHHFIHEWENQVIVVGNRQKSRVFEKAVLLSSKSHDREGCNYYPSDIIRKILNYNKSMNLSSLREFKSPAITKAFKNFLDDKSGKNLLNRHISQSL